MNKERKLIDIKVDERLLEQIMFLTKLLEQDDKKENDTNS